MIGTTITHDYMGGTRYLIGQWVHATGFYVLGVMHSEASAQQSKAYWSQPGWEDKIASVKPYPKVPVTIMRQVIEMSMVEV